MSAIDPLMPVRCDCPPEDCDCGEDELDADDDAWLVAAVAARFPSVDWTAVGSVTEWTDDGCLAELLGVRPGLSVRVYLDLASGRVFEVPGQVEDAEEMAVLVADPPRRAALTEWPIAGAPAPGRWVQ